MNNDTYILRSDGFRKLNLVLWTFCLVVLIGFDVSATALFKDSLWQSKIISYPVVSVEYGDLNGDEKKEMIYLTGRELVVMDSYLGMGQTFAKKRWGIKHKLHRMAVGDWDGDGLNEVLVTGFVHGRIFTEVYYLQGRE